MDNSAYSVRVDRSQGIVEIAGPDKGWVAEQLVALMPTIADGPSATSGSKSGKGAAGRHDTSGGKERKPASRSRRASNSSGKINPELSAKLSAELKAKLSEYLDERSKAKDAQSQATVIATFLLDELKWDEVTADDLFTVYSEMGIKIPATRAALSNAQARKGYFSAPSDGKYRVSHKGQNFARHDSKN